MGREIRMVPPNWEHPTDARGKYLPLHDKTHEQAMREYEDEYEMVADADKQSSSKEELAGSPPNPERYRPEYAEAPTHYQLYENVSEGTPLTPLFPDKETLVEYAVSEGLIRPESKQELLYTGSLPTASGIAPSIESQGPIHGFAEWADPAEVNAARLRDKHLLDQIDATVQEYKTGRRPNSWKPHGTEP